MREELRESQISVSLIHCRRTPTRGPHPTAVWLLAIAVTGVCSGCASGVFRASSLPPDLRIAPSAHGRSLDLSRLAVPKVDSSIIGAGDLLEVTLLSGYEQQAPLPTASRVSESGMIHLPQIGPVPVAGQTPADAEQTIARYSVERDIYRRPHVSVVIKEKHLNHVTVVGAVKTPGVVALDRSSSDLLGALATAGGLTESAGTEIQIMRKVPSGNSPSLAATPNGGPPVHLASHAAARPLQLAQRIDLVEATHGSGGDYHLGDGDVVMVSEQEPRSVYVMGLVHQPKEIEISFGRDLRVLDAIAQAGDRKFDLLADKVHVIRRVPHRPQPVVIHVSVREAKRNGDANLVLGAGDVVSVEETPLTFVLGALQQMVRFGISGSVPLF